MSLLSESVPPGVPRVGAVRCYWALIRPRYGPPTMHKDQNKLELEFVHFDPILEAHLSKQKGSVVGRGVLEFIHPHEREQARKDLMSAISADDLQGSVTRVRFARLSRIRTLMGCPPEENEYPVDPEQIVEDDEYIVEDVVLNWVADGLLLAFFHSIRDRDPTANNDPKKAHQGWSNWCGTFHMTDEQIEALHRNISLKIPLPPNTHRPPTRVFQLHLLPPDHLPLTPTQLVFSWPPPRTPGTHATQDGLYNATEYCDMMKHVDMDPSQLTAGPGELRTNCTTRYGAHHLVTTEGLHRTVASVFIPYGKVIFACFQTIKAYDLPRQAHTLAPEYPVWNADQAQAQGGMNSSPSSMHARPHAHAPVHQPQMHHVRPPPHTPLHHHPHPQPQRQHQPHAQPHPHTQHAAPSQTLHQPHQQPFDWQHPIPARQDSTAGATPFSNLWEPNYGLAGIGMGMSDHYGSPMSSSPSHVSNHQGKEGQVPGQHNVLPGKSQRGQGDHGRMVADSYYYPEYGTGLGATLPSSSSGTNGPLHISVQNQTPSQASQSQGRAHKASPTPVPSPVPALALAPTLPTAIPTTAPPSAPTRSHPPPIEDSQAGSSSEREGVDGNADGSGKGNSGSGAGGGKASSRPLVKPPGDIQCCVMCGTKESPEWRKNQSGIKDLCNACGLRLARQVAKQEGRQKPRKKKELGTPVGADGSTKDTFAISGRMQI